MSDSITIRDFYFAYRKAKADLYYSSNASLRAIADYEENLDINLMSLWERWNESDDTWISSPTFLGTWTLVPKSVEWPDRDDFRRKHGNGMIYSSPAEEWAHWEERIKRSEGDGYRAPAKAEFRLMARCSLDLHVLSTLWMLKVGEQFDRKLGECAYGNRLRRTHDGKRINEFSLGTFAPYLKPFREWRDRGIKTMLAGLEANKKLTALTADVSSFYHELNPHFLMDEGYLRSVLDVSLNAEEQKLHRLFIQSLILWAQQTPLRKGLPVGLPASAVIANVALIELDRFIEQQVAPLYYGRYVDDILMVMENGSSWLTSQEIWEWLFERSGGVLKWAKPGDTKMIAFEPSYFAAGLGRSNIHFANAKNKIFKLSGETGKHLVRSLAHEIHQRASEWRAMPRLPANAENIGTDLLAATENTGEHADNLRKADALTMKRAGFAIKLRDFEAYERDLPPESWCAHRKAFFRAFVQHVVQLPHFFELANYLPRVVRLAVACEDFDELRRIFIAVGNLYEKVRTTCTLTVKGVADGSSGIDEFLIVTRWRDQLIESLMESLMAAFPPRLSKRGSESWKEHFSSMLAKADLDSERWPLTHRKLQEQQARLFLHDLAQQPFRFAGLPKEMIAQRGIPQRRAVKAAAGAVYWALDSKIKSGVAILAKWMSVADSTPALLFPTRPINLAELCVLGNHMREEKAAAELSQVVFSQRGFAVDDGGMPYFDKSDVLHIRKEKSEERFAVAVASWKTNEASWTASVGRQPDPDLGRYARLNKLLDGIISDPQGARYLVLPELALPAHWFMRIARKLHTRQISLIAGVQYLHARKGLVRNQAWCSLCHDGLGFPSLLVYRQDKQRPALHEEQELKRVAGLQMKPERTWMTPPIVQHGNLRFAVLICSELTNIAYRAALRGKIDALFVPEWNQDTETFNALVESASLDMHAYVIQCNDRQFGDSRIRSPHKESWRRDVLRVKGGISDYCVIGEIDIQTLRAFQSSFRSASSPFKPVPDGFEISFDRKVLPL